MDKIIWAIIKGAIERLIVKRLITFIPQEGVS